MNIAPTIPTFDIVISRTGQTRETCPTRTEALRRMDYLYNADRIVCHIRPTTHA